MPVADVRGAESGLCNICGDHGPLTKDHTPPKGYARAVPVLIDDIISHIGTTRARAHERTIKSSDGVKFRSLCERCNRDLLGTIYDPGLIELGERVHRLLTTDVCIPRLSSVLVRPQRVMKSVMGHLCAQGVDRYAKGARTELVRDYLTDPQATAAGLFRMHYWLYPFKSRVLIKDSAIGTIFTKADAMSEFWLMKSYPLAFAITWNVDFEFEDVKLRNFDQFMSYNIDQEGDLELDLRDVPPELFPEAPQGHNILLLGEQAIAARPSPPRGRLLRR